MSPCIPLTDASRKGVPVTGLVALVLLVVACGGERKPAQSKDKTAAVAAAPTKPSFDPCALATSDEVKAAVGWTPTKAEASGRDEYGQCTYTGRTGPMVLPPEKVEVGISSCVTNFPCYDPLPAFRTSKEMADYRVKLYGNGKVGAFENVHPNVVALDGFGVPAIDHELADWRSIEMYVGAKRLVYVSTWGAAEPTRALAKKVLARAH